jgi:hypothetical protein
MNVKYIKLSRKCKYHTNLWSGSSSGCYYCRRALAHNKLQKLSPEDALLNDIFGGGRFVMIVSKEKNPNYKGKRPLLQNHH